MDYTLDLKFMQCVLRRGGGEVTALTWIGARYLLFPDSKTLPICHVTTFNVIVPQLLTENLIVLFIYLFFIFWGGEKERVKQ